jgi:hypothetical protein
MEQWNDGILCLFLFLQSCRILQFMKYANHGSKKINII